MLGRLLIRSVAFLGSALPLHAQDTFNIGIFGAVQSVTPLVVGGQVVDVPEGLPVLSALGVGQQIATGDTLAVTAVFDGEGLRARRLLEIYPVAGLVETVTEDTAIVLGSEVHLPRHSGVRAGDWIVASGFWSGAKVITQRLRIAQDAELAQLTGAFDPSDAGGVLRLGGSLVIDASLPDGGVDDDIWILNGEAHGDGLRVRMMTKGVFAGVMDLELWEGHASAPVASQTYMIHGTAIYGASHEAEMPAPGALIRVCAREGRVVRSAPPQEAGMMRAAMDLLGCNH